MSEFVIENNTVISYNARQEEVIVPDGVAIIGEGAFKGCASIRKITLPDSVERIEKHAFKGCRKLEQITMPPKLKSIGDYAFHRCHNLKEVVLPYAVKKLEFCVFLYCDNLRYVEMPGVVELGKQTFLNDVNLEEIVLSNNVDLSSIRDCFTGCNKIKKITLADGRDKVYDIKNVVDILAGREQVLPIIQTIVQDIYSILKIEDGVLVEYMNNVKNVELPEGITAIGKSCFYDKRGIQSVVFPKSLKKIGAGAFRGCISLEKVEFLQEDVVLEESAFLNCSALHEIVLPNERKYVLAGLREIWGSEVAELVKKIHNQVLENFVISGTMLIKYRGCETKVIVPDGITIIGQRAFAGNESIDRIELPQTVTCIEREAFAGCVLLQSIAMPENLEEIEDAAFENCVKLIRIHLQGAITEIPDSCFKRCKSLQEVYVIQKPDTQRLRVIENLAFYGCVKLKLFDSPEGLERIGDMAFYGCTNLKEAKFLTGKRLFLGKIGKLAFAKSGISQNQLPVSVTEEEKEESIYLRNVFAKNDFTKDSIGENVYHDGTLEIAEGTEFIEAYAYFGNETLTSVKLPESLKEIGEAAFYGCRNLVHVQFPKGKLVLQKSCFEKCILLEEVVCNANCVPQRAFAWCKSLKQIEVDGVQEISKEAFQGCMELSQIQFAKACYIGKSAFAMCDGLEKVTVGAGTFLDDFSFLDCGNLRGICFHAPIDERHFMKSGSFRGCTSLEAVAVLGNDKKEYCFCGYNSLFEEGLPQFAKRIYASALSVYEIDAKRKISAYHGFANKVTIPYGIKAIDREVFRDKENLKEIVIPDSVEEIGARAFDKTQWLRNQIEANPMVVWKGILIDGTACKGKVVLPPNIKKIAGWAFANNMQLTELQFTKRTQIEEFAFRNCIYLEKIILEDGTEYTLGTLSDMNRNQPPIVTQMIRECYNCYKMEGDILTECTGNIMQLKLPKGIKRIGKNVFKDSNLLTSLILNGEVTEIAEGAFLQCKWLRAVKNAQSVTIVGKKAFSGCIRLEEISGLKEGIQVGEKAFEHCISLHL